MRFAVNPAISKMLSNGTSNLPRNTSLSSGEENSGDPAATLEFKAIKIFFYIFILICSTIGNSMAAFVICTSKKMRTPSNLLILNLSICDLVTPLVSIPFDFALEENDNVWFYGSFMCKFLWPCSTFSSTAAALTLAAISLDRYRLIMHPFKEKLSSKQVKMIIVAVHVVSLLFVLPYIIALELRGSSCDEYWPEYFPYRKAYTIILFLTQYSLPLIFMVVMYSLALKNLRLSTHKMRKNSIRSYTDQDKRKYSNSLNAKKRPVRKLSLRKATSFWKTPNARATKMFIVVVVVFAIFMFPNQVLWMWLDLGQNESSPYLQLIKVVCWLFTYTNSVCNPVIYCLFSQDFRKGFKGLLLSMVCYKGSSREQEYSLGYPISTVGDSFYQPGSVQRKSTSKISTCQDTPRCRKVPVYTMPRTVSFDLLSTATSTRVRTRVSKTSTCSSIPDKDDNKNSLSESSLQRKDFEACDSLLPLLHSHKSNEDFRKLPLSTHFMKKNNSSSVSIPVKENNFERFKETDC